MSKQSYKDTIKGLGDKLKNAPINTPQQEVRPVETTPQPATAKPAARRAPNTKQVGDTDETHVNFWGPTELVQRLKIHSVKSGKSIKQLIVEALEASLPPNP